VPNDFGNNQIADLLSGPTENRLSLLLPFLERRTFLLRINMQSTRCVPETTSAFESNALRHIVQRHHSLCFCSLFKLPSFRAHLPPLNSPYMIHEAHSSAIRWHDTHPTTVPWNHAPWSRDPRPCNMPSLSARLDYPLVATLFCNSIYDSSTSVRQMQSFYLNQIQETLTNKD